jgi:hypothetical protein
VTDYDDLRRRARENAQGTPIPEEWGTSVSLEVGDEFIGRCRGKDVDQREKPIYLFWDDDEEPRFFWHSYRLEQGMEREGWSIGDGALIFRTDNYETRYDKPGEPTGLAYGVAIERNDEPLRTALRSPSRARAAVMTTRFRSSRSDERPSPRRAPRGARPSLLAAKRRRRVDGRAP